MAAQSGLRSNLQPDTLLAPAAHQRALDALSVHKNPEALQARSQSFNKQPRCVAVEARPDCRACLTRGGAG